MLAEAICKWCGLAKYAHDEKYNCGRNTVGYGNTWTPSVLGEKPVEQMLSVGTPIGGISIKGGQEGIKMLKDIKAGDIIYERIVFLMIALGNCKIKLKEIIIADPEVCKECGKPK